MIETVLKDPFEAIPNAPTRGGDGRAPMKFVTCIIRPESLDPVKAALDQLSVVVGMMVTDVRGFGRQKGRVEHYRGEEYVIRFIPKVKIEIAVLSDAVEQVIHAVAKAARTGQIGDGKVFVLDVQNTVRFRTGERGTSAL